MFNHCVIVISLWNFECLIQRVFLYFLETVMHMSTNIIFVCHFPGVNGSFLFKKIYIFGTVTSDMKILIIFFKTYLKKE